MNGPSAACWPQAGANRFVAGSYLFGQADMKSAVDDLRERLSAVSREIKNSGIDSVRNVAFHVSCTDRVSIRSPVVASLVESHRRHDLDAVFKHFDDIEE